MKGRIGGVIWLVVSANAVVLLLVLGLAYAAGARSGGLSLLDFGALPQTAGFEFLGALFLVVATTLWMILHLGGRIVKPVTQVADFTERLAAGDAEAHLQLDSADDFALIADNCNRMSETLAGASSARAATESLQNEAAQMTSALTPVVRGDLSVRVRSAEPGLQELSETVNSLMEAMATRVQRLRMNLNELDGGGARATNSASGVQTALRSQESSITEASEAAAQMTSALRESGKTARSTAQMASHASELAEHGNAVVGEASEGVERIRAAMADTASRIKALGDRSLQIYEIINIIQDTNLMALNAAIEASQARDAASGIQVLRTELNKLAEHSRSSVKEIVNLLKNIQAESGEVLALVEQANRAADVGGRLTEQCGKAFSTISATLRQSTDQAESMADTLRRQAEESDRIALLVRSVAADGQRALHAAQDVSGALQQVVKTTGQLNDALSQMRTAPSAAPKPRPELAASAAGD